MLPFDLRKALAGEPVITRSGSKVTQLTLFKAEPSKILAGVLDGHTLLAFGHDGTFLMCGGEHEFDLFMAQPMHVVNGFEVPEPLNSISGRVVFYVARPDTPRWFVSYDVGHLDFESRYRFLGTYLARGILHATEEAAIANAKAMINIDPTQE